MACTSSDTREATARWHQGEWKVTHDTGQLPYMPQKSTSVNEALPPAAPDKDDLGKASSSNKDDKPTSAANNKQKDQQDALAPQPATNSATNTASNNNNGAQEEEELIVTTEDQKWMLKQESLIHPGYGNKTGVSCVG
uniref:Uncharacterized protein n=1 Tax=Vitrella brassicaformis TaxID=1169539 RepID=A0A6U4IDP9_9ALVE|mmetsp:Transcript_50718/g.127240  ORF Transcript_50718/g.127240 Transcript_50718/m.127240 type:complete len:138 (+) Transcript_50718:194-607(+)